MANQTEQDHNLKEEMTHDDHLATFELMLDELCYLRANAIATRATFFQTAKKRKQATVDPDAQRAIVHANRLIAECNRREEVIHMNIYHHREARDAAQATSETSED